MKLELISIGSELLTGKTVNTNASWIGNTLLANGYKLSYVQTIVDNEQDIKAALELACNRADFVITTGGLGPTGDDITKACVAAHFGKTMQYHADIEQELDKRFPGIPGHDNQATYPEGAILLKNPSGTALGFVVENKVVCLPGVPSQMKAIFEIGVLPYLKKQFPPEYVARSVFIAGKIENDVDPTLRELEEKFADIELGICPSWGILSVYCVGKNTTHVDAAIMEIEKKFHDVIFSTESSDISLAVHLLLQKKKCTLAFAESCTGGYISSQITQHSGASDYFLGSVITYSNEAKEKLVNVAPKTLQEHGAVSEETAKEMASGAKKALGSDCAVGITGVAGPLGGTDEKPVGTVWIALVNKENKYTTFRCTRGGDRKKIIEYAANTALHMIWRECR